MPPNSAFETPQRLHPKTLVHRLLTSVPAFVLLALPLFRNPDAAQWISVSLAVLAGTITIPWIFLSYLRFRFQITEKEVIIDKGVINRRHRSIPIERIQNVEIRQTLLQRALGLARVRLETAGGAETEGVLQFVSPATARHIRSAIRQRRAVSESQDSPPQGILPEKSPALSIQLPLREVVLAGMFRFSLVYIALFFTALQYVSIQPEDVIEWLIGPRFRSYIDSHQLSYLAVLFSGVLLAAVLAWLAGILTTVNRFFGYSVWIESDRMQRRHGLFSISQGTVPLKRIQMLRYRSTPPMRLLDRCALQIQTMGVDPSQVGSQVALPLERTSVCRTLGRQLIPEANIPDVFASVSPLHIRRLFVRQFITLCFLIAPAFVWLSPSSLWILLSAPLLYVIAINRFQRHGYALTDHALVIRSGLIRHHMLVIPYDRIQVLRSTATLFQRRLRLKSIHVDVAGGERFQMQLISDLPSELADDLIQDLYARFRQGISRSAAPAL